MSTSIVLSRTSVDVARETRRDARYIGDLNDGAFRIDLSSALTSNDREDHYRFRVVSPRAYVRLYALEHEEGQDLAGTELTELADLAEAGVIRYQLFDQAGRVIADSAPSAGAAYERYQALVDDGSLELRRGTYTLRVARGPAAVSRKRYVYNLTLRGNWQPLADGAADRSLRVFGTTETPASTSPPIAPAATIATALLGTGSILDLFA